MLSAGRPRGGESTGPALLTLRPGHCEALRPPLRFVPSAGRRNRTKREKEKYYRIYNLYRSPLFTKNALANTEALRAAVLCEQRVSPSFSPIPLFAFSPHLIPPSLVHPASCAPAKPALACDMAGLRPRSAVAHSAPLSFFSPPSKVGERRLKKSAPFFLGVSYGSRRFRWLSVVGSSMGWPGRSCRRCRRARWPRRRGVLRPRCFGVRAVILPGRRGLLALVRWPRRFARPGVRVRALLRFIRPRFRLGRFRLRSLSCRYRPRPFVAFRSSGFRFVVGNRAGCRLGAARCRVLVRVRSRRAALVGRLLGFGWPWCVGAGLALRAAGGLPALALLSGPGRGLRHVL